MSKSKSKSKPYAFVATKKGFKIGLKEGVIDSWGDGRYLHCFTKPVLVKEGDRFSWHSQKGLIVNGKVIPVKCYPGKKIVWKIGWSARKIRVAVFPEGKSWIAADTRSYNVSQGKNSLEAIKNLIETLRFQDEMQRYEEKRGNKVVRWHVERTPGTKRDMLEMEKKAKHKGLLLEAVEWK